MLVGFFHVRLKTTYSLNQYNDNKKKSMTFSLVCVYILINLHFETKTIVVHDLSLLSTVNDKSHEPKVYLYKILLLSVKRSLYIRPLAKNIYSATVLRGILCQVYGKSTNTEFNVHFTNKSVGLRT